MFYTDLHCGKACFRAFYSEAALATSDSFRKIGSHIPYKKISPIVPLVVYGNEW